MPKELVDLAQVLGGFGVIIALLALVVSWRQLRHSTKALSDQLQLSTDLAKAANAQQLTGHAATFNATIYQDSELTALWYGEGKQFDPQKPTDRARYREMLVQWLIFHENIYYQHKKGLLDDDLYKSWQWDMRFTARNHNLALIGRLTDLFPGEFGEELQRLWDKAHHPS
jgi:hypothetical protein